MAKRVRSRLELREQNDAAERQQAAEPEAAAAPPKAKATRAKAAPKPKAPPKPRAPRKKKEPPRLFARWGVFDGGMHRLAVFPYNDRAGADAELAELRGRKAGDFFVLLVKEPEAPSPQAEALAP